MAALTGGRAGLEPALVQSQVELCLSRGEVYVAGQGDSIDGVLLAYAPGQDVQERYGQRLYSYFDGLRTSSTRQLFDSFTSSP